jgi:predicted ester cyclase
MTAGIEPENVPAAYVYRGFIDALNNADLGRAECFVDAKRYRENCVGFTHGFVDWEQSKASIRQVWKGLPDLHAELPHIIAEGNVVLAHGTVRGTATGRLYGAPATRRSYQANFFDYARVEEGADSRAHPTGRRPQPDAAALRQSPRARRTRRDVLAAMTVLRFEKVRRRPHSIDRRRRRLGARAQSQLPHPRRQAPRLLCARCERHLCSASRLPGTSCDSLHGSWLALHPTGSKHLMACGQQGSEAVLGPSKD